MKFARCYMVWQFLVWCTICTAVDEPDVIKTAVSDRLHALQDMIVAYDVNTTYTPLASEVQIVENLNREKTGSSRKISIWVGSERGSKTVSFLGGKAKFGARFTERSFKENMRGLPTSEVQAFSGKTAEILYGFKDDSVFKGVIKDTKIRWPEPEVEIGLGLRGFGQGSWADSNTVKGMSVGTGDDGSAIVGYVDRKGVKHEWSCDPKLRYAPVSYRRWAREGQLNHEMRMEDFEEIDGVMLPNKMNLRTINWENDTKHVVIEAKIEVIEYRLNDPENTPERYKIKWPLGTRIRDQILGMTYTVGGSSLSPSGDARRGRDGLDAESSPAESDANNEGNKAQTSVSQEVFIPEASFALQKGEAFILDLEGGGLIDSGNAPCTMKTHNKVAKLGQGDIAWDGSIVTVRKAKALTVSQGAHGRLECTPGRWCNRDMLPDNVELPYSVLVVTNEDAEYLITIVKMQANGIRVRHRKLNKGEVKRYIRTE